VVLALVQNELYESCKIIVGGQDVAVMVYWLMVKSLIMIIQANFAI